ncbi:MAG: methylmalonyl-CoA mutase family protein [Bacteroidales bacterium]|jgi:methylmalonyl-CoA mutase|nr:methylmalonyl-CoA mutase family protein [Bacteroidales bacterium]
MDNKLFNEFPPITTKAWEEIILKDLKGADYNKKLMWETLEGFCVKPYYRAENLVDLDYITKNNPSEFPFLRSNNSDNDWKIRQDIIVNDVKESNIFAKNLIKNGVNSLGFIFGKDDFSEEDIKSLLQEIDIENIEINFISLSLSVKYVKFLRNIAINRKLDLAKVHGSNEYDTLSYLLLTGTTPCGEINCKCAQEMILENENLLPNYKLLTINAKHFNNAGATIVQELAFGMAMGAEYLDKLIEAGKNVDEISKFLRFNFAVGSNYFLEIAKIRAARYLWAKIVEAYKPNNLNSAKIDIHCETSRWNKTVYDPYVNMLRVTTEAMSAILGGTNSLNVLPFDIIFEEPTDFSYRIARNVQLILKEEAHFGKIIDPGAGSYYIENLTNSLIENAWDLFLEVQEKGGFSTAFKKEFIQNLIEKTAKLRDKNIAIRKEILLGTNQYPNFTEQISNLQIEKCCNENLEYKVAKPIKLYRASEEFEEMRQLTDKQAKRPVVFMLTIGNLSMRKARAQFACNFFGCAGFEVIDNNGFETIKEGLTEAKNKKADIIVLCSSDGEYEQFGIELKKQTEKIIAIAGNPECRPSLEKEGITNFISVRSNVLEELKNYQKILGL